jgi:hypothetical protein
VGWKDPDRRREYQREWRLKNGRESLTPEPREAHRAKSREYYAANREAVQAQQRAYREKHKQRISDQNKTYRAGRKHAISARNRALKYGLTEERFNLLMVSQDFACAVCDRPLDPKGYRTIHVDHSHKTGAVRGILCSNCNLGIGHLREDPSIMGRAIDYLAKHS